MPGAFELSNLGAVWQSADFNHYLPCIEQLQRLGESFVEHNLQLTIGDDALLLGCLEYYRVRSVAQAQCS